MVSFKSLGLFFALLLSSSFLLVDADPNVICSLVNKERAKVGSPPVVLDDRLMTVAAHHNQFCISHNLLTHDDSEGDLGTRFHKYGYDFSCAGENVAQGFDDGDNEGVMNAWMNSPGHRANILNPSFRHLGVACGGGFWTQDFGNTLGSDTKPAKGGESDPSSESNPAPKTHRHKRPHKKTIIKYVKKPD
ncbi:12709_t:CDS:2, partial [Acaulospora morrowiae]